MNLKIESLNKMKRLRDVPATFDALKTVVESQLQDEIINGKNIKPES